MEPKYISDITVRYIQHMGNDATLAAAAWVSTSADEGMKRAVEKPDDVSGVINYLMKHRHGCYDDKTEVLTNQGWKKWPEVDGTEEFVTLNLTTDEIQYQKATNVIHKHWEGPMLRLTMQQVDCLVTLDHNMLSSVRERGDWKLDLRPAKDMVRRAHRLKLTGGIVTGKLHCPKEAALIGFIAADGNVNHNSISFHLKKLRKIDWLLTEYEIRTAVGDKYYLKEPSEFILKCAKETYTSEKSRQLSRTILDNGDKETITALLGGYLFGDGNRSEKNKIQCSTVSRKMVDDIQEAAMKSGKVALETKLNEAREDSYSVNPLYRLTIYNERNSDPRIGWTKEAREQQVKVEYYNGGIHCVTVPNKTLYVRRNGKPMWCGNTPFEHSAITFYVHAPIFVWREWHRHRIGFSYNEESARYKVLDPVFYVPPSNRPMMKVDGWKPGRPKFTECKSADLYADWSTALKLSYAASYKTYLAGLDNNLDPGLARDCLPVGIYSSCWVTCNPRSLMAFLSLRTYDESAKFVSYPLNEIEVAARQVEELLKHYWPITYSAFQQNGRVAP